MTGLTITGNPVPLAVGASITIKERTITQADIDAGKVVNFATAKDQKNADISGTT
jgi:hypothetical protein